MIQWNLRVRNEKDVLLESSYWNDKSLALKREKEWAKDKDVDVSITAISAQ